MTGIASGQHSTTERSTAGGLLYIPLPLEIIMEVVSHLESYDVLALLEAWPALKNYTVLITDHPYLPLFFDVEGVERRYLKESHNLDTQLKWHWFDSLKDRQPIQLVEYAFIKDKVRVKSKLVRECEFWLKSPGCSLGVQDWMLPNLTKTSFVFLRECHRISVQQVLRHFERELSFKLCHWHTGSITNFACTPMIQALMEGDIFFPNVPLRNPEELMSRGYKLLDTSRPPKPMFELGKLTTLRVETGIDFKDVSLPLVKELCIITAPNERSQTSRRIEISSISAPALKNFTIHYRSVLPKITRMDGLSFKKSAFATFELANADAIASKRYDTTRFQPLTDSYLDDTGEMRKDFSAEMVTLLTHFKSVSFIGVPSWVIASCDFSLTASLRWQISGEDPSAGDMTVFSSNGLSLPVSNTLTVSVHQPGIKLPKFNVPNMSRTFFSFFCSGCQLSKFLSDDRLICPGYPSCAAILINDQRPDINEKKEERSAGMYLGLSISEEWKEVLDSYAYVKLPNTLYVDLLGNCEG